MKRRTSLAIGILGALVATAPAMARPGGGGHSGGGGGGAHFGGGGHAAAAHYSGGGAHFAGGGAHYAGGGAHYAAPAHYAASGYAGHAGGYSAGYAGTGGAAMLATVDTGAAMAATGAAGAITAFLRAPDGAAAGGAAAGGRRHFTERVLRGSCRRYPSLTPRIGTAVCPITTRITPTTLGTPGMQGMSRPIRPRWRAAIPAVRRRRPMVLSPRRLPAITDRPRGPRRRATLPHRRTILRVPRCSSLHRHRRPRLIRARRLIRRPDPLRRHIRCPMRILRPQPIP